jgi:hypothetical protein
MMRRSPIVEFEALESPGHVRAQLFTCFDCDGSGEDVCGKECPGCCGAGVLVAMVPEDSEKRGGRA